jgi:hypothetical protein
MSAFSMPQFFRVRNADFNVFTYLKYFLDTAHKARYDVVGGKVCNNAGLSAGSRNCCDRSSCRWIPRTSRGTMGVGRVQIFLPDSSAACRALAMKSNYIDV